MSRPRFVWVTPEAIDVPRSGGAIRTGRLITALSAHAEVTAVLIADAPETVDVDAVHALGARAVHVFGRPHRGANRRALAARRRWPLSAAGAWNEDAAELVQRLVAGGAMVVVDHTKLMPYRPADRPWLLSLQNVDSALAPVLAAAGSLGSVTAAWRRAEAIYEQRMLRRWERACVGDSRCTILTVSEEDAVALGVPTSGLVVPNGCDIPGSVSRVPRRGTVAFIGSLDYPPNLEAVHWWANQVWPLLGDQEERLVVAGRASQASIEHAGLAGHEGLRVVGELPDVAPVLEAARVVAVPLRSGSGTRLKILEAMSHGRPVVTTSIGCAGLGLRQGEDVLVADDAPGFAAAVKALQTDDGLADRLATQGRFVATSRSWTAIGERFCADLFARSAAFT